MLPDPAPRSRCPLPTVRPAGTSAVSTRGRSTTTRPPDRLVHLLRRRRRRREGHQVDADPAGHPFCIGWGEPTRNGSPPSSPAAWDRESRAPGHVPASLDAPRTGRCVERPTCERGAAGKYIQRTDPQSRWLYRSDGRVSLGAFVDAAGAPVVCRDDRRLLAQVHPLPPGVRRPRVARPPRSHSRPDQGRRPRAHDLSALHPCRPRRLPTEPLARPHVGRACGSAMTGPRLADAAAPDSASRCVSLCILTLG